MSIDLAEITLQTPWVYSGLEPRLSVLVKLLSVRTEKRGICISESVQECKNSASNLLQVC